MSDTPAPAVAGMSAEGLALIGKYGGKARAAAQKTKEANETIAARDKEIAELKAANAKLTGDLDAAVKARGTPDEKDATIAELRGEITTGKHKAAFRRLLKDAGGREDAADALYKDLDYKADGDPDDAKIKAAIEAAKPSRAWAWAAPAAEPPGGGANPPAEKPIPGAGRGGQNGGQDGTIITAAQRADPAFMLNPANQAIIKQAAKEGRFR